MEKWITLGLLLLFTACQQGVKEDNTEKKQHQADSLFYMASSMITQNPNDLKNDPQALQYLNKAIELNPNKADYYLNRGAAKINLLMFKEAIIDFKVVVAKEERNTNALVNIALCYNHLKNYEQGINYASQAIAINEHIGYAYYVRSDSHLYQNNIEDLCKDLDAAIKLNYTPAAHRISRYCNKNFKHFKF